MGEVINDYELITPLQNQDAGFSRWTYAVRKGEIYFLKEFMDPVYPTENSLAENLRQRRIKDCEEYEKEKAAVYDSVDKASDGNLVRIFEFFRYDSHYYISTLKIDALPITFEEISAQPLEVRLLLCKTIAHSVMQLHAAHIVHADIKEKNILIQQSGTGQLIGKIIDFDCSFLEDKPPKDEDELGGDQVYLAPESCQFICGDAIKLTGKIDVFALGLLFHQYLTGELPGFDHAEYDYAHEAVLDEQELTVSGELPDKIGSLIHKMLICDPQERCSAADVFWELNAYDTAPVEDCASSTSFGDDEERQLTPAPQTFLRSAGDLE